MRRRARSLLAPTLCAASLLASTPAAALTWAPPFDADVLHDPSLGTVHAFAQSRDGTMWIGTKRALCRSDGQTTTCLNAREYEGLPDGGVRALLVAGDGTLWVGSVGGLRRFAAGKFERPSATGGPGDAAITALAEDAARQLWVGTATGLYRFADGGWRRFGRGDGLPEEAVEALRARGDGSVAVELTRSSARVDGERIVDVDLLPARSTTAFATRQPGHLATILPDGAPSPDAAVWGSVPPSVAALRDRDGRLWLGTYEGFGWWTGERFLPMQGDALPRTAVEVMAEDDEGGLWLGAFGSGLFRVRAPRLVVLTGADTVGGRAPFAIAEAPDGATYVTTETGLARFADGRWTRWSVGDAVGSYTQRSLAVARDGAVWMTTLGDGLVRFHDGRFTRVTTADGLPSNMLTSLAADGNAVLASTHDGRLVRVGDGPPRMEALPFPLCRAGDRTCPRAIVSTVPARNGGWWIATVGDGVWRFGADRVEHLTRRDGLPTDGATGVVEDATGDLWIATRGGLVRRHGGTLARLGRDQGLSREVVFHVVDDGARLWLATDAGVLRIDKADVADVLEGRRPRLATEARFGIADGLVTDETIEGFRPAAVRTRDGRVWIAMVHGLAVFERDAALPHRPAPRPHIERLTIDGRSRDASELTEGTIVVPPGHGDLEIAYTSPAFAAPHRLRFAYRLVGFDSGWIDAGARRTAFYTNLDPGPYRFELTASTDDPRPRSGATALAIQLEPHFRQTRLFWSLLALAAIAIAAGVQRWRLQQARARFAAVIDERGRIARDLHDTLAQVFSAIGFQLDSLDTAAPSDRRPRIERLRQMLAHGRLAARRVIWDLRAREDRPRSLAAALEELTRPYGDVTTSVTVSGDERPFTPEQEAEIVRVAEEAVSNAVAHGRARHVSIELQHEPDRFTLFVRDDGSGFDAAAPPPATSFGLVGMRERAARVGGELLVHAEPGVGTEIALVVPRKGATA